MHFFSKFSQKIAKKYLIFALFFRENLLPLPLAPERSVLRAVEGSSPLHETPKNTQKTAVKCPFPILLFPALSSLLTSLCPSPIVPHCFCHPRARALRFFPTLFTAH
jgi:hypothetical protein